jgi:hypothetical protein
VYAVSSTTTNKTQIGKNFGDGNEDKIWNFKVVSYFWIFEPCDDFIVIPWERSAIVVAMC